jgi:hypothetical protein
MVFCLDAIEETYNKDPLLTLYQKPPNKDSLSIKRMFLIEGKKRVLVGSLLDYIQTKKHGKVRKGTFSCLRSWANTSLFFGRFKC